MVSTMPQLMAGVNLHMLKPSFTLKKPSLTVCCNNLNRSTGMIGAAELRDRFVSIFSVAGRQMCEALFKEMAMLVPAPRRPQLLELCPDVSASVCVVCGCQQVCASC